MPSPSLRYARARRTRFYIYAMCLVDEKNVITFSLLFFSFLFFFCSLKNGDIEGRLNVGKSGVSAI